MKNFIEHLLQSAFNDRSMYMRNNDELSLLNDKGDPITSGLLRKLPKSFIPCKCYLEHFAKCVACHPGRPGKDYIHSLTTTILPIGLIQSAGMHGASNPPFSNDAFTICHTEIEKKQIQQKVCVTDNIIRNNDGTFDNNIYVTNLPNMSNIYKGIWIPDNMLEYNMIKQVYNHMFDIMQFTETKLHCIIEYNDNVIDKFNCKIGQQCLVSYEYMDDVYYGWVPAERLLFIWDINSTNEIMLTINRKFNEFNPFKLH
jgi:hypothetical protein